MRWLELFKSVLGYLSSCECGHFLQAGVDISWVVGKQKSPVWLGWRMVCLTEGACIKVSICSQFSSPRSEGCFLQVFVSSVSNTAMKEEFFLTPRGCENIP